MKMSVILMCQSRSPGAQAGSEKGKTNGLKHSLIMQLICEEESSIPAVYSTPCLFLSLYPFPSLGQSLRPSLGNRKLS